MGIDSGGSGRGDGGGYHLQIISGFQCVGGIGSVFSARGSRETKEEDSACRPQEVITVDYR